jgi:hypothetical protein
VRGKLGSVEMLETTVDLQVFSIEVLSGPRRIGHAGMPQILVKQ